MLSAGAPAVSARTEIVPGSVFDPALVPAVPVVLALFGVTAAVATAEALTDQGYPLRAGAAGLGRVEHGIDELVGDTAAVVAAVDGEDVGLLVGWCL